MNRFTENPENKNAPFPFPIHTEAPLDLYYNPIQAIEIGTGRIALHPEVIAAMPGTEHTTIADFNLAAFAALGVPTRKLVEIMPDETWSEIDTHVWTINATLGYPGRNALAQALYGHNIFKTTQTGNFLALQDQERLFVEWLATGRNVTDSLLRADMSDHAKRRFLRKVRSETGVQNLSELVVAATVAEEIDIIHFYQKPDTV